MVKEIYGKKIGMTQVFDKDGNVHGVSLVEIEPVCILEKTLQSGQAMVRIGCFRVPDSKLAKVKKPQKGYFDKVGAACYRMIREVPLEKGADLSFLSGETKSAAGETKPAAGEAAPAEAKPADSVETKPSRELGVEVFKEGDIVDVRGRTKGRGFTGGMKRHNWHGGPSGHGSMTHRRIGSNGSNTDPGRVVRGHRMPGHYGNAFRTIKNLRVLKVDPDKQLLFIGGAIPGHRGSVVKVKKV